MEKNKILEIITRNLDNLINHSGLSQSELARRCSLSSGTITKLLRGDRNITVSMVMRLAEGLQVDIQEILKGLSHNKLPKTSIHKKKEKWLIGILSINNKRITCIKNHSDKILGTSILESGLDLAETTSKLMLLIHEAIDDVLPVIKTDRHQLKLAKLNLVIQSYEFEETRYRFAAFAKKSFQDVLLLPDWQLTYLAAFKNKPGISLVVDKGVSLSYQYQGGLKKLGGWKFPVYDLGGENWLGAEAIRHTIEAVEGYIPMSTLAEKVLAKFNGKIEKIIETCFKGAKDPDIYCLFAEPLLRCYFVGDREAMAIIQRGVQHICRLIERVDTIVNKKLKITVNGSLADIYQPFISADRLVASPTDIQKVSVLADITPKFLAECGITATKTRLIEC